MLMTQLRYLPENHPCQRVPEVLKAKLYHAQGNVFESAYQSAGDLLDQVFNDLQLGILVPAEMRDRPPEFLGSQPFQELEMYFEKYFTPHVSLSTLSRHATAAAERVQLLRGFEDPDAVLKVMEKKVSEVIEDLPRTAENLERGKNPGDVLDPYILAAAQVLLYKGKFDQVIEGATAHKALMIIEGLMGHLHEDIIGQMRGNVRAPEPRKEELKPETNPFPGADIVQPPTERRQVLRFHQVKSKTGSAKGGDGARLGRQLQALLNTYGGEIYYDALIGSTLKGHRSRAGVVQEAPGVVVLVGRSAFEELTGSRVGPELLLRMYQTAFRLVIEKFPYDIDVMTKQIVQEFQRRAMEQGAGYLDLLLNQAIGGSPEEQDSRREPQP